MRVLNILQILRILSMCSWVAVKKTPTNKTPNHTQSHTLLHTPQHSLSFFSFCQFGFWSILLSYVLYLVFSFPDKTLSHSQCKKRWKGWGGKRGKNKITIRKNQIKIPSEFFCRSKRTHLVHHHITEHQLQVKPKSEANRSSSHLCNEEL